MQFQKALHLCLTNSHHKGIKQHIFILASMAILTCLSAEARAQNQIGNGCPGSTACGSYYVWIAGNTAINPGTEIGGNLNYLENEQENWNCGACLYSDLALQQYVSFSEYSTSTGDTIWLIVQGVNGNASNSKLTLILWQGGVPIKVLTWSPITIGNGAGEAGYYVDGNGDPILDGNPYWDPEGTGLIIVLLWTVQPFSYDGPPVNAGCQPPVNFGPPSGSGPSPNPTTQPVPSSTAQKPLDCDCSNSCPASTSKPIKYFNGEILLTAQDLESPRHDWFGYQRGYNNQLQTDFNGPNGFNWLSPQTPYVVPGSVGTGSLCVIPSPNSQIQFSYNAPGSTNGPEYTPLIPEDNKLISLTEDSTNHQLVYTEIAYGQETVWRFWDFMQTAYPQGLLYSYTDPAGNLTYALAYNSNGNITELQQICFSNLNAYQWQSGGPAPVWQNRGYTPPYFALNDLQFTYYSTGANIGRLQQITLRTSYGTYNLYDEVSDWQVLRNVTYEYYDGTSLVDIHGSLNDLRMVTVSDGSGNTIDTTYYRYYTATDLSNGEPGFVHGLKFVVNPRSYMRLLNANNVTDPGGLLDSAVQTYADNYFTYDNQRRVATETAQGSGCSCGGGTGQGEFSYVRSLTSNAGYTNGYNNWYYKTIETLPDGNTNTVYSNYVGQTILKVFSSSGIQWSTFYKYDTYGHPTMIAEPSAVTGYDETQNDLMDKVTNPGPPPTIVPYGWLSTNSGLIHVYDYAPDNPSATSASPGGAGNVQDFIEDEKVQQGYSVAPILIRTYQYTAHQCDYSAVGDHMGGTVYPLATNTVYHNPDGTGGQTTSYSYSWNWPGTFSTPYMLSKTTTLPSTSSQNGPSSSDVITEYYDWSGRTEWIKDADNFITYIQNDPGSGAPLMRVSDVNLTGSSYVDVPAGWSTPNGGGLNLYTVDFVDGFGRSLLHCDANMNFSGTAYLDSMHETRFYPALVYNSTPLASTPLYESTCPPVKVVREDRSTPNIYTETFTMAPTASSVTYSILANITDPYGYNYPTGGEPISNLQSLTRQYLDNSSRVQYSDAFFNVSNLTYGTGVSQSAEFGLSGDFYRTTFGYDIKGRPSRTVNALGTITDTVYDGLDRVVSKWIGTNDAPASGQWSPTNNGPPSNMVEVSSDQYDGGGVGDGTLTLVTQYVDSNASNNRVTQNWFDWRDRLVATKQGVSTNETDGTHRPISICMLDNLGRFQEKEVYDGDGTSPTVTGGIVTPPSANLLRYMTITDYDDQNRLYQSEVYSVDQSVGTPSTTTLTTNNYYDHRGDLIEKSAPGGLVYKSSFDGADRISERWITNGAGGSGWSNASGPGNDVVLMQTQYIYDGVGNVILATTKQRFNDDSTSNTGELGNTSNSPKAWVSFTSSYYDIANRLIDTVDLGRVTGDSYSAPTSGSSPPSRSSNVLVTSYTYNPAGWNDTITDPKGIVTARYYDALGRVVRQIEAYDGAIPLNPSSLPAVTSSTDRATVWTYDGLNHILSVQAVMPSGINSQSTQYNYSVNTSGGSSINSNDLLASVQYPDRSAGTPGTGAADQQTYTYNTVGQQLTFIDQNQTTHTYTYDVLGRRISDSVAVASGNPQNVDTSVLLQTLSFDTGDRPYLLTSYSTATANSSDVVNQAEDLYNGLSQLTQEYQSHSGTVVTTGSTPTPSVQYGYTLTSGGVNNSRLTSKTYPNGRVITFNYGTSGGLDDTISRVVNLMDASSTDAAYTYMGLKTVVRKDYTTPEVRLDYWNNNETTGTYQGLDSFMRVSSQTWEDYNATSFNVFQINHGYDNDSNRIYADDQVYTGYSHLYTYDNLNRLTSANGGQIASGNGSIQSYWQTSTQNWTLDTLGNQTAAKSGVYTTTFDSRNEPTTRSTLGPNTPYEFTANVPFNVTSTGADWSVPTGATSTFDVNVTNGSCLTIDTVTTDTLGGYTEPEPRCLVLLGAPIAKANLGVYLYFPPGTTSGQAGFIFGYKSANDYWLEVLDVAASTSNIFHVVNGTKNLYESSTQSVPAGSWMWLPTAFANGGIAWPFGTVSGGNPSGQLGLFSNVAGVLFWGYGAFDATPPMDLLGRWQSEYFGCLGGSGSNAGGLYTGNTPEAIGAEELKNMRIKKFQSTVAFQAASTYTPVWLPLVFNAIDNFNYSMVWFGLESNPYLSVYFGWGNQATFTMTASQVLWARTQYDGTTLTGWLLAENPGTIPSESAWAAVASTPVLSTTYYSGGSGGLIGIQEPLNWYQLVMTHFTLKSWDTATSAFDITEADDSFTVDSNGYADDTLANDNNGNLLYDGLQVYTYDAWNRLKTVAHGYRDSSGTLHSGQVFDTMSYDARGRRIAKAITTSTPWDCTYNYYLDGDSVIEERNGSNQMIKQMVWGPDYIDDLIEVSLAISPSGQYGNGTANFWICQDANWNVLGLLAPNGLLAERYQYTPYGQRQVYSRGGSNDPLCYTPQLADPRYATADGGEPYGMCEFGHQGLMQDEESGLVYGRARYLQSTLGRWMEGEPFGARYVDGLNLYDAYDSNPLYYVDPSGLRSVDIYITINPTGLPNNFNVQNVESKLNGLLKQCACKSGDNFNVHLKISPDKPNPPSGDMGWQYDRPGGGMNASAWDWVPFVNFGTLSYRAISKNPDQYLGYVFSNPAMPVGLAHTGNAITEINWAQYMNLVQTTAQTNGDVNSIDWAQTWANALAHEQIHLGAMDSHDYGSPGDITSGTAFYNQPATVTPQWCKKFLSALGLSSP